MPTKDVMKELAMAEKVNVIQQERVRREGNKLADKAERGEITMADI